MIDGYDVRAVRDLLSGDIPAGPLTTQALPAVVAASGVTLHSHAGCTELNRWGGPRRAERRTVHAAVEDPRITTHAAHLHLCWACTGDDLAGVDMYLSAALRVNAFATTLAARLEPLERAAADPTAQRGVPWGTLLLTRSTLERRLAPPGRRCAADALTIRLPAVSPGSDDLRTWTEAFLASSRARLVAVRAALRPRQPLSTAARRFVAVRPDATTVWPHLSERVAAMFADVDPVGWLPLGDTPWPVATLPDTWFWQLDRNLVNLGPTDALDQLSERLAVTARIAAQQPNLTFGDITDAFTAAVAILAAPVHTRHA